MHAEDGSLSVAVGDLAELFGRELDKLNVRVDKETPLFPMLR